MVLVQASERWGLLRMNYSYQWEKKNATILPPFHFIVLCPESHQKSFPINAGSANLNSLLLFSLTTGSLDTSS